MDKLTEVKTKSGDIGQLDAPVLVPLHLPPPPVPLHLPPPPVPDEAVSEEVHVLPEGVEGHYEFLEGVWHLLGGQGAGVFLAGFLRLVGGDPLVQAALHGCHQDTARDRVLGGVNQWNKHKSN